ncbi:hypothetical protein CYFUS_006572 [Cystobacter fuscus]|uniref:N-acetyltransferase domain-containing protein n=1 Tax=Cystobacter fuscus TaxID=43 RepID=A0A250JBZ5_9BACT|nr:GNAT family N-acetyltransferase [Cystobacter fuscus]ATB41110.1 hypothetical protein CYFUS_006572 [Cystobacter fuscus]
MMDPRWEWALPIREAHLQEKLLGRYTLASLERKEWWDLYLRELAPHFPEELFFSLEGLLSEHERQARKRVIEAQGAAPWVDYWCIRDGEHVAAMFLGRQQREDVYLMDLSIVHPDARRKGLYSALIQRLISYTRALGFHRILSSHAPSNNPVIIAKLKQGFSITGLEIDAEVGPNLLLTYFHNPEQKRAYEYRCGGTHLSKRMVESSQGSFARLQSSIAKATGD